MKKKTPFYDIDTLAVSGSEITSDITLNKCRSLAIQIEMTFGGSIDADATVDAYFSSDGNNWDSIAYTSWAITYTVSTTVRRTVLINVPEHGFIKFKVTNGSSADTITKVKLWKIIQRWD